MSSLFRGCLSTYYLQGSLYHNPVPSDCYVVTPTKSTGAIDFNPLARQWFDYKNSWRTAEGRQRIRSVGIGEFLPEKVVLVVTDFDSLLSRRNQLAGTFVSQIRRLSGDDSRVMASRFADTMLLRSELGFKYMVLSSELKLEDHQYFSKGSDERSGHHDFYGLGWRIPPNRRVALTDDQFGDISIEDQSLVDYLGLQDYRYK